MVRMSIQSQEEFTRASLVAREKLTEAFEQCSDPDIKLLIFDAANAVEDFRFAAKDLCIQIGPYAKNVFRMAALWHASDDWVKHLPTEDWLHKLAFACLLGNPSFVRSAAEIYGQTGDSIQELVSRFEELEQTLQERIGDAEIEFLSKCGDAKQSHKKRTFDPKMRDE
ncbi:MAG: hypothetical protein AAGA30_04175 [Planctomycetota bacterium]